MRDFTTELFDEQTRAIAGDPAGDTTTTETIAIGETVTSVIDSLDDADWYAIGLTAGQTIDISLIGGSLFDPYVYVYDSNGSLVAADDDISWPTNPDSLLQFTAPTAGVFTSRRIAITGTARTANTIPTSEATR
ncbi:MAG: PPC domain-containing protein [Paracoccaceae bacterium]